MFLATHALLADVTSDAGPQFDLGMLLLIVLGVLAVFFVSMLGPISRIYEHRAERRREDAARRRDDGNP